MKTRSAYWLTETVTALDKSRAELLYSKGVQISFFTDLETVLKTCESKRVSTIIVNDSFPRSQTIDIIESIAANPNLYGVRILLNRKKSDTFIDNLAYKEGFRDLIPSNLPNNMWVNRVSFSSSITDTRLPVTTPNLGLRAMARVCVPTRIIWLGPKKLKIESKVEAKPGDKINLIGPLADKLGQKVLSLTVDSREISNLRYRFGNAFVCSWNTSKEKNGKLRIILNHIESQAEESPIKIFMAVSSASMRSELISSLSQPEYVIASALSRNHIITEPKYYGPDIVFIEDELCKFEELGLFGKMAENLPKGCPIVIIGEINSIEELRSLAPSRKIHVLPRIKKNLNSLIFQRYLKQHKPRSNIEGTCIPDTNPMSHGELYFSARLTSVSPYAATVKTPINIGKFGLCRIESPFFKRIIKGSITSKISDNYKMPGAQNQTENYISCHFSNISKNGQLNIGRLMVTHLSSEFNLSDEITEPDPIIEHVPSITTTPVIDILKTEAIVENLAEGTKGALGWLRNSSIIGWGLPIIAITIFFIMMFKGLEWVREEYASKYQKSGRIFSDQLEQFQKSKKPKKNGQPNRPIKLFPK